MKFNTLSKSGRQAKQIVSGDWRGGVGGGGWCTVATLHGSLSGSTARPAAAPDIMGQPASPATCGCTEMGQAELSVYKILINPHTASMERGLRQAAASILSSVLTHYIFLMTRNDLPEIARSN